MDSDKLPTLNEYFDALESHDWFYDYSEDREVFANGTNQKWKLQLVAQNSEPHKNLYREFYTYKHANGPKPQRPE